jgi:hypothetical protein
LVVQSPSLYINLSSSDDIFNTGGATAISSCVFDIAVANSTWTADPLNPEEARTLDNGGLLLLSSEQSEGNLFLPKLVTLNPLNTTYTRLFTFLDDRTYYVRCIPTNSDNLTGAPSPFTTVRVAVGLPTTAAGIKVTPKPEALLFTLLASQTSLEIAGGAEPNLHPDSWEFIDTLASINSPNNQTLRIAVEVYDAQQPSELIDTIYLYPQIAALSPLGTRRYIRQPYYINAEYATGGKYGLIEDHEYKLTYYMENSVGQGPKANFSSPSKTGVPDVEIS